jgi:hypothetical protein
MRKIYKEYIGRKMNEAMEKECGGEKEMMSKIRACCA